MIVQKKMDTSYKEKKSYQTKINGNGRNSTKLGTQWCYSLISTGKQMVTAVLL